MENTKQANIPQLIEVERGFIQSEGDFVRLNIVDWNRFHPYWKSSQHAMKAISSWFINTSKFAIVDVDLCAFPNRNDFPDWKHIGGHHTD